MHLKVKVTPDAKHVSFKKLSEDTFAISVKEPKKQNMANKAVLNTLASNLRIPVKKLRIISGHHKPSKIILVSGA